MTITCSTCGVWTLDDSYKKIQSSRWAEFGLGDELGPARPGTLWAFGESISGSLGLNSVNNTISPAQIGGHWNDVSSSPAHSMIVKCDGTLWGMGCGQAGRLAQGGNCVTNRSSPNQIPGTQWSAVANGSYHAHALKSDGTLWAWGCNFRSALGIINAYSYRNSPHQIPGNQWVLVHNNGNNRNGFASKSDGTLWSWGNGQYGQHGQNNTIELCSPTQVPGLLWRQISVGNTHALGIKSDGTLWAWGDGSRSRLGTTNLITRSSPTQIPGNQWNIVSAGDQFSIATKIDGTLWTWGYNANGQLGHGDKIQKCSPTQVPGTQWVSVNGGSIHAHATKTDGTLWGWGRGSNIGHNDNADHCSPVQINGNQWFDIAGNRAMFARQCL